MRKLIILLVVFIPLVFLVNFFVPQLQDPPFLEVTSESDSTVADLEEFNVYIASLTDVSGGDSFGEVEAYFLDDTYYLKALLVNLPTLTEDYFYEGWLVRKGENPSVISTGVAKKDLDGGYSNIFTDIMSLLDHDFYILTLEPNDGDPAPAEHVLEGILHL